MKTFKTFWKCFLSFALPLCICLSNTIIAGEITIAVTGDIHAKQAKQVSDLILAQTPLDAVLIVGDTSNAGKSPLGIYQKIYKDTYDRFMDKIFPCPGNHDGYSEPPFSGYMEFWGKKAHAPEMYYSFDLGDWHIISLNSESFRGDNEGFKKQLEWLKKDLAANSKKPIIAYWHRPLFSQAKNGGDPKAKPLWEALLANGPALVFNGHNHIYERFAPLDQDGKQLEENKGIQSFGIGPGGHGLPKDGQKRSQSPPAPLVFHQDSQHVGFFTLQSDGSFKFTIKAVDRNGIVTVIDEASGKLLRH